MVDAVTFSGTHAVPVGQLRDIIVTFKSGLWHRWFGMNRGPLTCLDSVEVLRDAQRISEEYAERGYPGTKVSIAIGHRGSRRAQVNFAVQESPPIVVDSVSIIGVPKDAADAGALERMIKGAPLDTVLFIALRDSVQTLIRAAGYALAAPPPDVAAVVDETRRRASVTLTFVPGRIVFVGAIAVKITPVGARPALDTSTVRALLQIKPGDPYSTRQVAASQREIYGLELYRTIKFEEAPYDSVNNLMPLRLGLIEGARHRLRLGAGWGTLDCLRTQVRFVDQNTFSSGHRLELNGRLSKIGLADPFTSLSGICPPLAREDPFSKDLNYYAGATLNLRGLLGARLHPAFTVYSERRSEFEVYEQTTDIGVVASITRDLAPRRTVSLQYQFVNGRTIADGAISCERFGFCRLVDLASFRLSSPIHTITASIAQNPLLPIDDPDRGYRWQFEVRQGYTNIGRTVPLNFTRMFGEAAYYLPLGPKFTLAARAQLGFVQAPRDVSSLLPPAERFYGGGQSSVRGYGENALGPGSYIVDKFTATTLPDSTKVGVAPVGSDFRRIAPSGGNAIWLANLELRTKTGFGSALLRWVVFLDAGRVWNTADVFSSLNAGARITPGVGLRLATPLGPFRMDVGYSPYNYEPGPAFFVQRADAAKGIPGRAICVSPGTTDPLVLAPGQTAALTCPASFTPNQVRSFISRLAFHFSIGNAF
jgi:outer membrane protein assembly factor BamA